MEHRPIQSKSFKTFDLNFISCGILSSMLQTQLYLVESFIVTSEEKDFYNLFLLMIRYAIHMEHTPKLRAEYLLF